MDNSVFHRLAHVLWVVLVAVIVTLAVYVSFGRLLLANVSAFHSEILWELNQRSPVDIEADGVRGQWRSFSPVLVLNGVRLSPRDQEGESLVLDEGRLTIDMWSSLRSGSLQFVALHVAGLRLQGEMDEGGRFGLRGFVAGDGDFRPWLEDVLLNLESMSLDEVALQVALPEGEQRELDLSLSLEREGSKRWLEAELLSTTGTRIDVRARGQGNPFKPEMFNGVLYLDFDVLNLQQVRSLLPENLRSIEADGSFALQTWFGWDRGRLSSEAQLDASQLTLRDAEGAWEVPVDRLALDASLVRGKNRWTVFVDDLELVQRGTELLLPRLQLDTWGDSLRLRAEQVALGPANELFVGAEQLPQKLRDVFEILNLGGTLPQLEFSVFDLSAPAEEWALEANFDGLEVDSWRGAPGVRSGRGHVSLGPGGGTVILDSQRFSMAFPTVYREPLYYDDFFGSIHIAWDKEAVVLSSGPVTARGVEGEAQALFGLNIPLKPTDEGIEMELLVGLADSYPIYRTKYLPYILPATLQDWLRGSVGEGRIEQGAFLWRGSLRKGADKLRTIQLFFNVADTMLTYHPDWPAASAVQGTVLIDDLEVSVWADKARLLGSEVERLSVEAWPNDDRQIMLAVRGEVEGSARDGLAAVNASPLSALVGDAFQDWQAEGGLHTSLNLLLNLSEPNVPEQVDVATRWSAVDIDISPGDLEVKGVSGELFYDSSDGFSSTDLVGTFWGRPLSAELVQTVAEDSGPIANGPLEVRLSGAAMVEDVRKWLDLGELAFAEGETAVDVLVDVQVGEAPRLVIDSNLEGVALDLPEPWAKDAAASRPLHMETTLGSELGPLSFRLGEELFLDLKVGGGQFEAAALAFGEAPVPLRSGALMLTGETPLLPVEQWLDFVSRYFSNDPVAALSAEGEGLEINLFGLQAGRLDVMGRQWQDVTLDLVINPQGMAASVATSWLEGQLSLPRDEVGRLAVRRLDLDALLGEAEPEDGMEEESAVSSAAGAADIPQLPTMEVELSGVEKGGQALGDFSFTLATEPGLLTVRDIRGDLNGLQLSEENTGSLAWRAVEDGSETSLEAPLQFADLGATLEAFGYQKSLETQSGEATLVLNWPGGPQDFSLATSSGRVELNASGGRFLNTDAGTSGALRVISVLNMADLISRLSLNQVFETGVPFHTMGGQVDLDAGRLAVEEFQVLGSSSSFDLTANADMLKETIDGELIVTLPLASNLPWMAALAAASWPVAAGVFVVGKVFEEQFNRLSSGVYSVSGPWSDPQVELTRAFDNTPSLPKQLPETEEPSPLAEGPMLEAEGEAREEDPAAEQAQFSPDSSS